MSRKTTTRIGERNGSNGYHSNGSRAVAIRGSGGGGKGGGGQRAQREDPDSLNFRGVARIIDGLSEGVITWADPDHPLRCVALDSTVVENTDGTHNFHDFDFYFLPGTRDQGYLPGFNAAENISPITPVEITTTSPWTHTFNDGSIDAIRIDINFPRLARQVENGDIHGASVRLKIEVKEQSDLPGAVYVQKVDDTVVGYTPDPYIRTYRLELAGMQAPWDVRVTRITADSGATSTLQNESWLSSYSQLIYGKLRYPNTALVGFSINAEQFGSVPTRAYRVKGVAVQVPLNYDPITRAYDTTPGNPGVNSAGFWNGQFKTAWTNNPAWCYFDMCTNKRYGFGRYLEVASVNKFKLYTIAQYCDQLVPDGKGGMEPRFTCGLYLQKREDALKVLADMASIFRGMQYYAEGVLNVTQDRPRVAEMQFGPANVIDGQFVFSGTSQKARHTAALVSYNDQSNFGKLTVESFEDSDGILKFGYLPYNITNIGCISRMQARRSGKWALTAEKILTDTVAFGTGAEGYRARPGMVIALNVPFRAGERWSGKIISVTATSITLDKQVEIVSAANPDGSTRKYYATFTVYDTTVTDISQRSKVVTVQLTNGPSPTTTVLTFATQALLPQEGALWQMAHDTLHLELFSILAVTPRDNAIVDILALEYNDSVYDHIDDDAVLIEPPVSDLPPAGAVEPPTLPVTLTMQAVTVGTTIRRDLLVSWGASPDVYLRGYRMSYRVNDGNWERGSESQLTSATIQGIASGIYEVSIVAVNRIGALSAPITGSTSSTINEDLMPHATGLEVEGSTTGIFEERDCHLACRLNSPTLGDRGDHEASAGQIDPYFVAFEWIFIHPDTDVMYWRELTTAPNFVFTREKNSQGQAVFGGPPLPEFRVEVRVLNTENIPDTHPARIRPRNPRPPQPVNFIAQSAFQTAFLKWDIPYGIPDLDYTEILMWQPPDDAPEDPDVIPHPIFEQATRIATVGRGTSRYIDNGVTPGVPRWYYLRNFDTFGSFSDPTEAAQVTPGAIGATDIDDFGLDASNIFSAAIVLQGDIWRPGRLPGAGGGPGPGDDEAPEAIYPYINWNAHSLFWRGCEYNIPAGETNQRYVYWHAPSPPYPPRGSISASSYVTITPIPPGPGTPPVPPGVPLPVLSSENFQIARNDEGNPIIAWYSFANAVIGSANIVEAAIQTAHIGLAVITDALIANVDAAKITTGFLGAARIAAGAIDAEQISIGASSENLITNPSFEFDTKNWINVIDNGAVIERVTGGIDGNWMLRLAPGAAAGHRVIPVRPGQKYVFRVIFKSDIPHPDGLYIGVDMSNNFPASGFSTEANRNFAENFVCANRFITTEWTTLTATWTAWDTGPMKDVRWITPYVFFNRPSGSLFIDGIVLSKEVEESFISGLRADQIISGSVFTKALKISATGSIQSEDYAAADPALGIPSKGMRIAGGVFYGNDVVLNNPIIRQGFSSPSITPPAPYTFVAPQTLTITYPPAGYTYRYTKNGVDPTSSSMAWTAADPLPALTATTRLKVALFQDSNGAQVSPVWDGTYTLGTVAGSTQCADVEYHYTSGRAGIVGQSIHGTLSCATAAAYGTPPATYMQWRRWQGASWTAWNSYNVGGDVVIPCGHYIEMKAVGMSGVANSEVTTYANDPIGGL